MNNKQLLFISTLIIFTNALTSNQETPFWHLQNKTQKKALYENRNMIFKKKRTSGATTHIEKIEEEAHEETIESEDIQRDNLYPYPTKPN